SNGFNALAKVLREDPSIRLGKISVLNPNIPDKAQATLDFKLMMRATNGNVSLTTSVADKIVPLTGKTWADQIEAAAAAGVPTIKVLRHAGHNLDSIAGENGKDDGA